MLIVPSWLLSKLPPECTSAWPTVYFCCVFVLFALSLSISFSRALFLSLSLPSLCRAITFSKTIPLLLHATSLSRSLWYLEGFRSSSRQANSNSSLLLTCAFWFCREVSFSGPSDPQKWELFDAQAGFKQLGFGSEEVVRRCGR